MKIKRLHIVSFTIPWPADYGGVIDVFHKIRHLHLSGWEIDLHCFHYGRKPANELKPYVQTIRYYPRKRNPLLLFSELPYIVSSRNDQNLVRALLSDDNPVLIEGLHCTHPLLDSSSIGRRSIVRTHNIEHDYYRMLAGAEKSFLKSIYYRSEASKLELYEPILSGCHGLATISETDQLHFKRLNPHSELIFPFHAFDRVAVPPGCGSYSLFHGALHVAENHRAAMWLLNEVAPHLGHTLVIAGSGIHEPLRRKAANMVNVRLVESPTQEEMEELIRGAQSHLLPAFAQAGMRLKLLHALFHGRHVITNGIMLRGTQLHSHCILAETAEDFICEARACHTRALDESNIKHRHTLEESPYSNKANVQKLAGILESATRY